MHFGINIVFQNYSKDRGASKIHISSNSFFTIYIRPFNGTLLDPIQFLTTESSLKIIKNG